MEKGVMAEENMLANIFSGTAQNMCSVVTKYLVESYKVHEVCIT
jgi:hypothetical protein